MDQLHLFIWLLLRGPIISKCSLEMSGKVREFNHDWRVANLWNVSCVFYMIFNYGMWWFFYMSGVCFCIHIIMCVNALLSDLQTSK